MPFYDPSRIRDLRFIPIYPLPLAAAFAIALNSLGAVFGKDPTQLFEDAEQNLKKLDRLLPNVDLCVEIRDIFTPYALYKIKIPLIYDQEVLPKPQSAEDCKLLEKILEYSVNKAGIDFSNWIDISKPRKIKETINIAISSNVEFVVSSAQISQFVTAFCENQKFQEIVTDPRSVIQKFADYDGLIANTVEYRGYDLRGQPFGFSGAIPSFQEPGLRGAREYAEKLQKRAVDPCNH